MHRQATTLSRSLVVAAGLVVIFLAGCDDSNRYPAALRYPERADLVLKTENTTDYRVALPPPGKLDEAIREAADKKLFQVVVDPKDIDRKDRAELTKALEELFGTPAAPSIAPIEPTRAPRGKREEAEENLKLYESLLSENLGEDISDDDITYLVTDSDTLNKLTVVDPRSTTLAKGSELYRRHCMHCHGVAGDGRGPTGAWVDPHPRDYRQGVFKFLSTTKAAIASGKPRKEDLIRTLEKGIDGTSMPAFGLLPRHELEQLASYVIHLSLRGEVEYDTLMVLARDKNQIGDDLKKFVYQRAIQYTGQWARASKMEPNRPAAYPYSSATPEEMHESISRGYKLFIGKAECLKCHMDYGRQSAYRYDAWGTLVRARNLTETNYRGGRRPIDIYWRISGGIPPSGMPAHALADQEMWDLVNFVQALPYPGMLPDDVKHKVYPSPGEKH